jgi:uracil-DNA glycosylase
MPTDWNPHLRAEFDQPYWHELQAFVRAERERGPVFPPEANVFRALHATSLADTKVVILGQDPYHGPGQATGLSFSVGPGVKPPPSLVNIMKEMHDDIGAPIPAHGTLDAWTAGGVLLLNTTLTVRGGEAASHQGKGWEAFTDKVIGLVASKPDHVVFVLWGAHARKKKALITAASQGTAHTVIESAHPSPLSAHNGFFGSKPFSRTNEALLHHQQQPIDWTL